VVDNMKRGKGKGREEPLDGIHAWGEWKIEIAGVYFMGGTSLGTIPWKDMQCIQTSLTTSSFGGATADGGHCDSVQEAYIENAINPLH